MNSIKRLTIFILIAAILISPSFAKNTDVKIVCNGKDIGFEDTLSPYYDVDAGRIYVPVRPLTQALGADVSYESSDKTVTINTDTVEVKLQIGSSNASVNEVGVKLDAPAFLVDGSTYVPLRFVSESFLMDVSFDSGTNTAKLTDKAMATFDMSIDEVKSIYGEPDRIDMSEKGYEFYVYSSNLKDYKLIGIKDGKVVSYYLESETWMLKNGLRSGMSLDRALECFPSDKFSSTKTDSYVVVSDNDTATTLFFDETKSLRAVLTEKAQFTRKSKVTADVLTSFELELADLINVQRAKKGLSPLAVDTGISAVAKQHAADMAKGSFFSHTGSDGSSPTERLTAAGFSNFYQLEIISEAYPNALCAFSGHIILPDYHTLLEASYKKIGVGVAYNQKSDGVLYYNHIFYADK